MYICHDVMLLLFVLRHSVFASLLGTTNMKNKETPNTRFPNLLNN